MQTDEILDLVDADDQVIGTIARSDYNKLVEEKLGYIRAAEMLIMNDQEQLWIPTRTANKTIAPNGLDYSMSGHVDSGETYMQAALREIKEELNLDLKPENLVELNKFEPDAVPYIRTVYIYKSNVAPDYNREDFASAEWMSPSELIAKLDAGTPAKTSLHATISYLLESIAL